MGLRAALRVPRGVEEAVILAADGVSLALRNEGRRGGLGGDCAKSSTCVAEFREGNGWEEVFDSGGIEELMAAIGGLNWRSKISILGQLRVNE